MKYFGPYLEPLIGNLSIWNWMFEGDSKTDQSPAAGSVLSSTRGFVDSSTGELLSYKDLKSIVVAVSTILSQEYEVRPKQTIAIVGRNSIWYPAAMLAASRLGAVVTILPPEAMKNDLAYFFRRSKTSLVFSDDAALDQVKTACQAVGIPPAKILRLEGPKTEEDSLQGLRHLGESLSPAAYAKSWVPDHTEASPCAFLCWSSGTTGKPKAVRISHKNVINQMRQMKYLTPVDRRSTVLGILPFYHITGLIHLLHLPIILEQHMIIMARFDMKQMMRTIVQFKCDELWLVPPLLIRLLNDQSAQGYDLSFVKQFNTGAAPLADQVIVQLEKRFPKISVRQAWGMTETTSCLTVTPPGLATWRNASKVGKLVPGTEIRIVDPDTGHDVPKGKIGEIWAKGPQVTMGYLDRAEETATSYVENDYFRTGDLGSSDEEGFITIHDRIKEMIKVRGHAVAPAELEDVLHGHPKVKDAAIIGIPDDYSGEIPRAFVVLRGGVNASIETTRELRDFVAARKPKHKRLSGGIEYVNEIPKSASGKILRRVLKDWWKEKRDSQKVDAKL
ncbi:hypothetical protein NW762_006517 [Fusarium torreyae]|uniref:Phenylacetyl-CoA ligase n=1 Tax=Fusarium torreyae TaxID=1237075 RepID=A0A9W8RZ58_9HYPO|nr:hypothetical protein NW762_006517 [Fusarium torreyae]